MGTTIFFVNAFFRLHDKRKTPRSGEEKSFIIQCKSYLPKKQV